MVRNVREEPVADNLYLLCRVGENNIAIRASAIEAVSPLGNMVSVPRTHSAVRGIAAIRSRLLTVIDTAVLAGVPADKGGSAALMVITSIEGHGYGLLVNEVDDVVPLDTLREPPAHIGARWLGFVGAIADFQGLPMMIVSPDAVVAAAQEAAHGARSKAA